jgi:class 3 adenylate cyclase
LKLFIKIQFKRYFIFLKAIFFGFFFSISVYAQDDSNDIIETESYYLSKQFKPEEELAILQKLSKDSYDPNKIIKYSDLLLDKAMQSDSTQFFFGAYLQKGNAYRLKGDLSTALELYQLAAKNARKDFEESDLAIINVTIGDVHSEIGNHENADLYYTRAIKKLRELIKNPPDESKILETERYLIGALLNAGDEYFNVGKYEKALSYFYEASALSNKIDFKIGSAYSLGGVGMVYAKQNKPTLAEANMNEAISILEKEGIYNPISEYLNLISDIYLTQNQTKLAIDYAKRSLEISNKYQLKDVISQANLQLSKIYEEMDDSKKSLYHLREYVMYKDSIIDAAQKIANQQTEFEVAKKQLELDLEVQKNESEREILLQKNKNERIVMYSFIGGMVLVSFLALGLYRRNRYINKTKAIIEDERKKADDLLKNILPIATAKELKEKGKVIAHKYESVTIAFTDFKDFTKIASRLAPEELVESVDMYFSEFDKIIKKYHLEKIKTIGDSYMYAGGIPGESDDHALRAVQAAHEILDFVNKLKKAYKVDQARFDIRIGIHTGPVVAGVVGKNKFSYDIWGDSVNIASRMESSCEAGKINVSQTTYEATKEHFLFESRGKIDVKNRGQVDMYYVTKKPAE